MLYNPWLCDNKHHSFKKLMLFFFFGLAVWHWHCRGWYILLVCQYIEIACYGSTCMAVSTWQLVRWHWSWDLKFEIRVAFLHWNVQRNNIGSGWSGAEWIWSREYHVESTIHDSLLAGSQLN